MLATFIWPSMHLSYLKRERERGSLRHPLLVFLVLWSFVFVIYHGD